jgi:DNA-binding SARP family transcriptional activator
VILRGRDGKPRRRGAESRGSAPVRAARHRCSRAATHTRGPPALALYDEAFELWRGEPLADFAGECWATVTAARLRQLQLAAFRERAEAKLPVGRHVEVETDRQPHVDADPSHEALDGLLMTSLYRAGRQADALEVFTRTHRHLDDELGFEPSAVLRTLHQRILVQNDALAAAAETAQVRTAASEATRHTPASGQAPDTRPPRTPPIPAVAPWSA